MTEWTADARLREVLGAPRGCHFSPATRVIERPGWYQIVTPTAKDGTQNEVLDSALDPVEADAVIDETIESYRSLGLRFKWIVGPETRPTDMSRRLAERGFEAWQARGMCTTGTAFGDGDAGVEVEEVTRESVGVFARVGAEGWGVDPDRILADCRTTLETGRHFLFLVRADGQPAGTAFYARHPRSAYLMGGMVLPRFRGRGLYRALVAARIRHAAERGATLATSHAREETSAPILARLGFETVCRYDVHRSPEAAG